VDHRPAADFRTPSGLGEVLQTLAVDRTLAEEDLGRPEEGLGRSLVLEVDHTHGVVDRSQEVEVRSPEEEALARALGAGRNLAGEARALAEVARRSRAAGVRSQGEVARIRPAEARTQKLADRGRRPLEGGRAQEEDHDLGEDGRRAAAAGEDAGRTFPVQAEEVRRSLREVLRNLEGLLEGLLEGPTTHAAEALYTLAEAALHEEVGRAHTPAAALRVGLPLVAVRRGIPHIRGRRVGEAACPALAALGAKSHVSFPCATDCGCGCWCGCGHVEEPHGHLEHRGRNHTAQVRAPVQAVEELPLALGAVRWDPGTAAAQQTAHRQGRARALLCGSSMYQAEL